MANPLFKSYMKCRSEDESKSRPRLIGLPSKETKNIIESTLQKDFEGYSAEQRAVLLGQTQY